MGGRSWADELDGIDICVFDKIGVLAGIKMDIK